MEQVKRYAGRAAALVMACFVVAFSVSVPAAAATGEWVVLEGSARFRIHNHGNYGSFMDFSYPIVSSDGSPVAASALDNNTDLLGLRCRFENLGIVFPGRYKFSYRVSIASTAFSGFTFTGQVYRPYLQTFIDGVSAGYIYSVEHSYSLEPSPDGSGFYLTDTVVFDIPAGVTFTNVVLYASQVEINKSFSSPFTLFAGLYDFRVWEYTPNPVLDALDGITTPSPEDNQQSSQIQGSVNDKTQQSNQITNQIEQLQKPNVDSSSGKPVVGGMVVDPMQQVDRDSFNAYTKVLGTIFGSSTILGYFIIVFSLIFISYVIFGKSGG